MYSEEEIKYASQVLLDRYDIFLNEDSMRIAEKTLNDLIEVMKEEL